MADKSDKKYSKVCKLCQRDCKQDEAITVVSCPRFIKAPVQLMVPLKFHPGRPKKAKA
ncbi:MAG TPA: hypothetical protein PKI63_09835 [Candidatus Cloacimonadota bacterium]|mgnify:FL=1|jgi:hypothetical protein|nr:hypothetical protein [Candidatus Cloacimonadota bacterium]HPN41836.1 hypothetical protein [Candidatus Cloacimonadota bacterium]